MYNRTLLPERLLTNITILVPNGTTQHGNERLLCLPITSGYWPSISSVIIFFAANYLAHAATVKSSPGDATLVQACNAFLALMFPMSGLLRALNAIFRYSRSAKTALEKACNAGALCMVVRDRHWQPERPSDVRVRVVHRFEEVHDEPHIYADWTTYLPSYAREKPSSWVHFDSVWAQSYVNPRLKRIHGTFALPEGYTFAIVPRDTFLLAKGAPNRRGDNCSVSDISASTSSLKAVASMVQIIAAFTTLLSHRSDLTGRWGYASYHLTVIPYLFMTLVNLVSNLIIADYPCLYMVRTDTMAEAERAGGIFEAEVAQTVTLTDEDVDLNEDAAYGGITIEKIVSFATTFTNDWMIFWPLSAWEYISEIPLRGRLNAKAHRSPRYTSTTVDLQICEDTRVHHVQQLSTVPSSSPTIFDDPIDLNSSESYGHERAGPNDLEDGLGIAMRFAGESYPNDQPKSRYVDAFSSSQRYRIHFHDSPQGLAVGGFDSMLRSAIKDKVKRVRSSVPSRYHSGNTGDRVRVMLLQIPGMATMVPEAFWQDRSSTEHDSTPASTATFYYPGCARFLRSSSRNHHTRFPIGRTASDEHPPTLPTEPDLGSSAIKHGSHTRSGVFLEISVGLLLVGLFFGVVAALTQFRAGQSSTTERGVMMAWLASGLYGCCLPFMSTSELRRIFYLLPLLSLYGSRLDELRQSTSFKREIRRFQEFRTNPKDQLFKSVFEHFRNSGHQPGPVVLVLSLIPLAIFIPPIWGFVLVGRMLVEWGNCTRLY